MFNTLTKFWKPKKNIPQQTPPIIPKGKKIKDKDEGIFLTEFAFNTKWQIMEERMKNTNVLIVVAIGALFICFLTLFFGYWQFAQTSYDNYSERVKELDNQRYQFQQSEIEALQKMATTSAIVRQ